MALSLSSLRFITLLSIVSLAFIAPACGSSEVAPGGGEEVPGDPAASDAEGSGGGSSAGSDEQSDASGATGEDTAGDEAIDAEPEGPGAPPVECVPICEGMVCGDDGCGGSCGECPEGESCTDAGLCEVSGENPCEPECADMVCGDDGCGGSCGDCPEGESCNDAGMCEEGGDEPCVPDCADMECGDDGCGGSCGDCPEGEGCALGVCSADPCTPNPCTEPPSDGCEGDTPVVYEGTGECIYIGDTTSCSYGFTELEPCAEGTFCSEGECIEGGAPTEFGEDVSVITEMILAGANDPDDCCFDFDNDGQVDNGVGGLLATLGSFLNDIDIDSSLAEAIDDGSVTIVLEADGVDDLVDDDAVDVRGYVGYYDDEGDILIQPGSFNQDGTPLVYFADGEIAGGVAIMGPTDFQTSLPLAGFNLSLEIKDARGQTDVSATDDGERFDMTDGKLGGLIPFGDIISTLNMVASTCECMDLNGQPMFDMDGEDSVGCSSAFDSANPSCTDADGSLCSGLASIADQKFLVCNIGLGLIKPDIDTDFNGKGDHFSVGLRFSGEAAEIEGLGDDQALDGCGDCSGGGGPLNVFAHLVLFGICFALVTRKRLA